MISTTYDHAKDGGKKLPTKMHCVPYLNSYLEALKIGNANAMHHVKIPHCHLAQL